jgi:hypothetical protein
MQLLYNEYDFNFLFDLYRLIWWLDPAILTLVSMAVLIAVLVDYLVPTIASSFCRADSWTGAKERRLEEVCRSLAGTEASIVGFFLGLHAFRTARPKLVSMKELGYKIKIRIIQYSEC